MDGAHVVAAACNRDGQDGVVRPDPQHPPAVCHDEVHWEDEAPVLEKSSPDQRPQGLYAILPEQCVTLLTRATGLAKHDDEDEADHDDRISFLEFELSSATQEFEAEKKAHSKRLFRSNLNHCLPPTSRKEGKGRPDEASGGRDQEVESGGHGNEGCSCGRGRRGRHNEHRQ